MSTMLADAVSQITSYWWTFLVRGLFAFAIAAWAFASPSSMASGLVYLLAAYFIVTGVVEIIAGVSFTGVDRWWAMILVGALEAFLGVYMLVNPGVGPLTVAYLVAIWAIATGLLELVSAIRFRQYIDNDFWWGFLGVLTIAVGVYIIMNPSLGLLGIVYAIGVYGVLAGIALCVLAFRIKNAGADVKQRLSTT